MKIFVTAKPGSQTESIQKISDNEFIVRVKEAPEKGKANKAIARSIAEYFDVPFSEIRLISGASNKKKIFEIT